VAVAPRIELGFGLYGGFVADNYRGDQGVTVRLAVGGGGTASGRWAVDGGGAEEDDAGLSEEELRGEGGRREVKGGGGRREVGVELT
jgi:hypothetical protein